MFQTKAIRCTEARRLTAVDDEAIKVSTGQDMTEFTLKAKGKNFKLGSDQDPSQIIEISLW